MTHLEMIADLRSAPPDVAAALVWQWAAEDAGADLIAGAIIVLSPEAGAACGPAPPGWRLVSHEIGPGFWSASLAAAGRTGRSAVVLMAPVCPGYEAVGAMLHLLDSDAMHGAVAARLQCWEGCCFESVRRLGDTAPEWIPLAALAELSPHELLGDVLAPCIVVKPLILTDFGETDPPFESLAGAVAQRLMAARRCGYRTALANRAMVRIVGTHCNVPSVPAVTMSPLDAGRLQAFAAESGRAWSEGRGPSIELMEKLTGQLLKVVGGAARPSLLLDLRNVRQVFNGTSLAAMGAASGLHRVAGEWDVSVLADPGGAAFHDFESLYPGWTIHTAPPSSIFTAALRLSQPWHIQDMVDLHQAARVNAYLMLDSIAWDVSYVAPRNLDGTWRFLAASADGLLFISDFSQQRFNRRFPRIRCPSDVCHLSFDPDDYTRRDLLGAPQGDYILVVGNHLDHKDVAATVGSLASAFPFERIEVLGPSPVRSPRVATHTSGNLAEPYVHRLYASAKIVVFPSFYEGFGFPVITALSYGRTLFARDSLLLHEVAAYCPPTGRLHAYRQRDDVVDAIGRMLHEEPVAQVQVGARLDGQPPRSWREVGVDIDRFLRTLIAGASTASWRDRDERVSQALAYRT